MRTSLISLILTLALALPAFAGELGGVTLPETMPASKGDTYLNGMAQRSVIWIDVYVAGLYLNQKTTDAETALAMGGAKKMVMVFQRDVGAEDICDAWKEGFEDNVPGGGLPFVEQLEQLCKDTPVDTLEGQTAIYSYCGVTDETTYEIDGQVLGTYRGAPFFNALLSCWIGPEPGPGEDFKKGILGQE